MRSRSWIPKTIHYTVHDVPPATFMKGSILFPPEAVPASVQDGHPNQGRDRDRGGPARGASERPGELATRPTRGRSGTLLALVPVLMGALVLIARRRDRVPGVPDVLEEPTETDSVEEALLWSAWRGHLSLTNAYRAQLLRLANMHAIEITAVGTVTEPVDLVATRGDETNLERDQDFLAMLFANPREDGTISLMHPARSKGISPGGGELRLVVLERADAGGNGVCARIRTGDARFESVRRLRRGVRRHRRGPVAVGRTACGEPRTAVAPGGARRHGVGAASHPGAREYGTARTHGADGGVPGGSCGGSRTCRTPPRWRS